MYRRRNPEGNQKGGPLRMGIAGGIGLASASINVSDGLK
jgi:hypothetical protein